MESKNKKVMVAVSGGFDPVHIGHVRMFCEARKLGDSLVVILNNDHWLKKKKGFSFMPEKERKEILESFRWVDKVVLTSHPRNPKDMSVSRELLKIKPAIFVNGGDRNQHNTPENEVCKQIGCRIVFGVGRGGKVQSSSWLLGKHLGRHKVGKKN
ncbi:MAG: adenylyltransferase/cytidyltransferase family protein [Candidatus Sungbacteria bacterium]|uniref:Adenylyltransferase/cytidyltransferase family protein n=1 Tax=Candidatus Sungiibacteriota bacterium TaxID=2750080 RepID=A0A9D6LMJ0_9BACT|nr:adenylyltransferase/cytidyltransferase family protein [Candidatus Sungbacteria bacterium]